MLSVPVPQISNPALIDKEQLVTMMVCPVYIVFVCAVGLFRVCFYRRQ